MLKDNLKKVRLNNGLTQAQVAERLGVSQAQYARWESGGRNPKYETIKKLADVFNTTTEALNGRYDGIEEIVRILREYDLTDEDKNVLRKLGINVTFDPYYQYDRLYRK